MFLVTILVTFCFPAIHMLMEVACFMISCPELRAIYELKSFSAAQFCYQVSCLPYKHVS